MNRLLYFLFFILVSQAIIAQDVWIEYTENNTSLPDNRFNVVFEDADGVMWAGSSLYGLYKFVGNDWVRYTSYNSDLISNFIQDMLLDVNGSMWIATSYGISIFENGNYYNYDASNSNLSADRVVQLGMNASGEIFSAALDGLVGTGIDKYNSAGFSDAAISYPTDIYEARTNDWSFDANDKLWIASTEGLTTLSDDTFHVYTYADLVTYGSFYNVVATDYGIFASSSNSLKVYDGINWLTLDYNNLGISSGAKITEMMLEDNYLWLVTANQLLKYNMQTDIVEKSYDSSNSLIADYEIYDMIKTSTGEYWFAGKDAILRFVPEVLEPSAISYLPENKTKLITNQAKNSFMFSLAESQPQLNVSIVNTMGQVVHSADYQNVQTIETETIETKGIYFVVLTYANKQENFKILIK